MKKQLAIIAAIAALTAAAAASCGREVPAEDTVSNTTTEMTVASGEEIPNTETTATTEVTKTTKSTNTTKTTKDKSTKTTTASTKKGVVLTAANERTTKAVTTAATKATTTDKPRGNAPLNPASPPPVTTQPATEPEKKPSVTVGYSDLFASAAAKLNALGEPNDIITPDEALPNGAEEKIYKYDDIEVCCFIQDGTEYIFSIIVTGGEHSTDRGIKVGSSRADVEAAYGTGEENEEGVCYSSGDKTLIITYSDDTVSSIKYNAEL